MDSCWYQDGSTRIRPVSYYNSPSWRSPTSSEWSQQIKIQRFVYPFIHKHSILSHRVFLPIQGSRYTYVGSYFFHPNRFFGWGKPCYFYGRIFCLLHWGEASYFRGINHLYIDHRSMVRIRIYPSIFGASNVGRTTTNHPFGKGL